MATGKRRAAFFTPLETDILMRSYGEFEHIFRKKCNTAAVAKERETAWENIAARLKACNPAGEKRTWQQFKMKYKNIVQTGMRFPVDFLPDVSQAELEQFAHNYNNNLLWSNPDSPEQLTLSDSTQVTISISSVGFIPLYGSSDKHKILALFTPSDPLTAVALYLLDQWWTVDDILKTADPARDGVVEVETVGERIVLYILNRVIYRAKEMSSEELPFLCHGEQDHAKILWNKGEAVGFYSVKPSGSLCKSLPTKSYQLPVMDSIFVRKSQRGKGFGLQMLEDFVLSFKEDFLGLRYPLTTSMYKVCEKYLFQYPEDSDLLWEVESIGGPNQRTNIASKLKAMNLSAVSKGLTFTEESLVITEVTEKDVVMEEVTTQIKETESIECTVEIVEEVTVLKATKVSEADMPVTARGRSGGSKQRIMDKTIMEDKSETVNRIEEIEAETPKDEQVSAKQKTEMHDVSELVQTKGMFTVASDKTGEDTVRTAPEEEATTMSDKQVTILASQDQEEDNVTSMSEVPQAEANAKHLNTTPHDSPITVENVASEIKEAGDSCQKEDTEVLADSQEVLEVHKEAGTLNKVSSSQTQNEVTDEKSKGRVTQQELSLSTHVTLEGEALKTGITVGKDIKFEHSETPRRRSQRHRKPEESVEEKTTGQDEGKVLRRRTVLSTSTPKCKYTRHSKKIYEELQKEFDEMEEKNAVSTTTEDEQFAITEEVTSIKNDGVAVEELGAKEEQMLEDEQQINEQEREKQKEPGMKDSVLQGSSTELQDTTETAVTKEHGNESSVIQNKLEVSDNETEEPPVIQRKSFRGRRKVTSKPNPSEQGKRHQKQEEEHSDEAELGAGGSASEEKADEKGMDKELGEQHQVEQEETVEKAEEISTQELNAVKECIIPLTVVNMEENKEVTADEETKGEIEMVSLMEADNKEVANGMVKESGTVITALETVIPNEDLDEAVLPVSEELQEKAAGSNIPKLQKATVILVDLKTSSCHPSVKKAEETTVDEDLAVLEKEQMEMTAAEEKEVSSCIEELQTAKPKLEEEDGGKKEEHTEKSEDAAPEADTVEKEELEENSPDEEKEVSANLDNEKSQAGETTSVETKDNTITEESDQQQEQDNINDVLCAEKVDEAETGTVTVEKEIEVMVEDDDVLTLKVEKKQFPVLETCVDTEVNSPFVDIAEENLSPAKEEEAPVKTRTLRSGKKAVATTPIHKTTKGIKQADVQEAENSVDGKQALTTTLRQGCISASATPKGKSRKPCKQIQEEEQKEAQESISVKDDEKPKELAEEAEIGEGKEEAEGLESAKEQPTEKDKGEDREGDYDTMNVEKELSEEGTMTITKQEKNTAGATDVLDDLVQGDNDTPLAKLTSCSTILTPSEEETAKDQKSEEVEPQISDLQRVTVLLADLKNAHHFIQEEISAVEEGVPAKKTATDEHISVSPVEIEETELDKKEVEKEVFEEKVEDPLTIQDTGKEEAVELAKQDEAGSVNDEEEEEPTATEPRTLRSRKQDVKATPTCRLTQSKQKKSEEEEKETSEIRKEPAVRVSSRVLRKGRKSTPVTQRHTEKRTQEQQQKEEREGEEESTEVEERETEKKQVEEQQTIEQEKGDRLEAKDANQQEETIEPEMGIEIDHTVVVKAVIQQEEGLATSSDTFAEQDLEAPVQQSTDEGNTSGDVAEEAVITQPIVEGEQSSSMSELATVTANNKEKDVFEEEKTVTETRVLRSCKKTVRATPRCRAKKRNDPEEDATDVKSAKDEPAVERRVLRKGRQSAATPRFESKRARTQCQTEEEVEETTPDKDMQVEEAKAVQEEAEVEEKNKDEKIADINKEKTADQKEENIKPEEAYEQKEKAAGEGSTVDELALETRILRKGKRSAASKSRCKSKRAGTQCVTEDKVEKETTQAKDIQIGESQADDKDNREEILKKSGAVEPVAPKEGSTEPKLEIKKVKVRTVESLTEQETMEEEQSVVSQTCTNGQKKASVEECAKEVTDQDEGKVSDEKEAPVIETRLLRSGVKSAKGISRSKTKQSQEGENEEEGVENSVYTDDPTGETRVLRSGRRSAPSTPKHISKGERSECQPEEEEEEETSPAEETEGEEKETGQKLLEERGDRGKTEEEGESMKKGEEKDKDVEKGEENSMALGDMDQMRGSSKEEAVMIEEQYTNMAVVDETCIEMVRVEETNLAEEDKTTVFEKCTIDAVVDSTSAEEGTHTAVVEEDAHVAGEPVETGEEAPAVTTRTLRSKTKTLHATPSRRSKRQKDHGAVETKQQEVENPEDEEMQEVHQLTDDSLENRELNAKEQVETDEISPPEQEAGSTADDNADDQAKEIELTDDKVVEPTFEDPAKEETESPEEELSQSKEDKTVDSSEVECRNLRQRRKIVTEKEDKAEEIPKRGSLRKRRRVKYMEKDEDEDSISGAHSDEDKDNKKPECSANEPMPEESSGEENLEGIAEAVESTSEKEDIISLVLDTNEEVKEEGLGQDGEDNQLNMSEEEVETKVIESRVLRGRSIPSLIITPQCKSRRSSSDFKEPEGFLSVEKKSPQSGQKRSLGKRKSTEVTPTRKCKITAKCRISEYYD